MLKGYLLAAAAVAFLVAASPVLAGQTGVAVIETDLDFRGFPAEPTFDYDSSPVYFGPSGGSPYLSADADDDSKWFFKGRQEYSVDYPSTAIGNTLFGRTSADVTTLMIDKDVVNTTGSTFNGYTITLARALLVENSLVITGVDYTLDIAKTTDSYGNINTTITITFDQPVADEDLFHLSYAVDISGIAVTAAPPPDDFEIGEGGPHAPEPGTLALLAMGSAMLFKRRRQR